MKRVCRAQNLVAAHHAMNLLRNAGIPAVVRNEFLASAMGELPPAECFPEVWIVEDADEWRARKVLENPAGEGGTSWICGGCGEISEPQFTQCWRCGATRPA